VPSPLISPTRVVALALPLFFPLINYYFTTIQSSSAAAAVNAGISSTTTNDQAS